MSRIMTKFLCLLPGGKSSNARKQSNEDDFDELGIYLDKFSKTELNACQRKLSAINVISIVPAIANLPLVGSVETASNGLISSLSNGFKCPSSSKIASISASESNFSSCPSLRVLDILLELEFFNVTPKFKK